MNPHTGPGPAGGRRGGRLAVVTAVAGTVFIAAGAFWLSFTALADLARRSGVGAGQAWAWPLIVDGIIVVATVAVVALAGQKGAWYPWVLLVGGAVVSVTANAIHAVVAADADVPGVLAAAVAAVPPVVLLAITHLTVLLTRPISERDNVAAPGGPVPATDAAPDVDGSGDGAPGTGLADVVLDDAADGGDARARRRELAAGLRGQGWSNKAIARRLGVAPSTVGRWLPRSEARLAPGGQDERKELTP